MLGGNCHLAAHQILVRARALKTAESAADARGPPPPACLATCASVPSCPALASISALHRRKAARAGSAARGTNVAASSIVRSKRSNSVSQILRTSRPERWPSRRRYSRTLVMPAWGASRRTWPCCTPQRRSLRRAPVTCLKAGPMDRDGRFYPFQNLFYPFPYLCNKCIL